MGLLGSVIGAVAGGLLNSGSAGKSTKKIVNAQKKAIGVYDQTKTANNALYQPYAAVGTNALAGLNALNRGDYSAFQNSPDYQFARQEGMRDLGNSFAARGGAFSGNALRGITQFNQGLATQNLENYRNSLFRTAGIGLSGVGGQATANQNYASDFGHAQDVIGGAQASGVQQRYQGYAGLVNSGIDILGQIFKGY